MALRRRFRFARFALGLVLAALVVDSGLRLIEATPLWRVLPLVRPLFEKPDRDVGLDSTPGVEGVWPIENRARVRFNALGLRGPERTLQKPPGVFRIALVGDSMTEAAQVSQRSTFAALTERRLRAEGRDVEVLNLGMAGPHPLRGLLRLEKRGWRLAPDVVVANNSAVAFTDAMLLDDSENPGYVDDGHGGLVRGYGFHDRLSSRYADTLIGHVFVFLYQHSPLVRMLYLQSKEPWREQLGLRLAQPPSRPASAAASCQDAMAALPVHLALWRDHQPARTWAATTHFLDELAAGSKQHAARLVVAMRDIPLATACPPAAAKRAELIAAMDRAFATRGIRFVDWNAAVAAVAGGDLGRLQGFGSARGFGHLNYDGHRAWAATLAKILEPYLPSRPPG